jgi:hypothetical protein
MPMKWVTRERPKIDRIACPWLIARFIDQSPEFLFVPATDVMRVAEESGAIPYDVPGVELSHVGDQCSFDAFLRKYTLTSPALARLAVIVRGADTARLDLAPEAAGLFAISLGLSNIFVDDHEMLRHGMVMYDALLAWCVYCQNEPHSRSPKP